MIFEFSYPDIVKQCNTMAFLNVISFCLLSGCGSMEMPDEQELSQIYKLLKETNSNKMPKNIAFMSSLYKRCIPIYAAIPETPYDFKSFRWLDKKMKRYIEPDVLAHSISSMTALIPVVLNGEIQLDNKEFIAYCLGVNSMKQARFLVDFLKLGDFYYSGEDTGDNAYGEYKIVINNENPDMKTQFFVTEALSSVLELADQSGSYPRGLVPKFKKSLDILPVLCENVIENINDISSRDLSVIGLSLLSVLSHTALHKEAVYNTVNAIGFELCERLVQTGDISRNISDDSFSSFITLCNCMNCLIKLHEINDLIIYETSYLKLYDRIDSYWDESSSLFLTSGKNKQKYSFKETSAVLSALRTLRTCLTDADLFMHVDRQLSSFYSATFISSKLFNNQFYPILQESKLELHNLGSTEKNTAPVFSEYFEVKVSKRKYHCEPGVFQAEDILSGCRYLLY
ncbi:MAG: hypothetical protein VB106_07875 [Clostridiaceae bacterium]|jgi:hypothetical protein|nr:hypothetical protein [Clostridiaceae bacterium]